ncbi:MAG TPA: hypothetical protein VK789_12935 [Bryobacteraceae bacterium]|nr:hypothetical protein [Bryobacteraceae bacterium]
MRSLLAPWIAKRLWLPPSVDSPPIWTPKLLPLNLLQELFTHRGCGK